MRRNRGWSWDTGLRADSRTIQDLVQVLLKPRLNAQRPQFESATGAAIVAMCHNLMEKPMHTHFAQSLKLSRYLIGAVAVVCLGTASASAQKFARFESGTTITGECCVLWGEKVTYKEPPTPVPLVVTWNTDYTPPNDATRVGLSVNRGQCQTEVYGSQFIPDNPGKTSGDSNATFQFVIFPKDNVLMSGANSFELCGGGKLHATDSITFGLQTLTVSKY